jgi:hypothetical protein
MKLADVIRKAHASQLPNGGMGMKRAGVIFLAMLLSCVPVASLGSQMVKAETSTGGWTKTYGGTGDDRAHALVQTGDGGYVLGGSTKSFGAGLWDFWLVKTDAYGTMMWNMTYGGTGDDVAWALVQTDDGRYALAGWTESFGAGNKDFWLVKTDASGNMQWNQTYGGTGDDVALALVRTSDGGYALTGTTHSFDAGNLDTWLVKTDASGTMQWNRTYGGTGTDAVHEALTLVQTDDGGYALAGITRSSGAGWQSDFWLVKTDSSGNMMWNKTYGGTRDDEVRALVQTDDEGYALVGWTVSFGVGDCDFWLVKTDAAGNMQWNRTYGGTLNDYAYALVQTTDGGYALAGGTDSFGVNGGFWLVKTDSAGTIMWNKSYGGTGTDAVHEAHALVQTSDGGYALAGITLSLGAGNWDFWLVKTDASGVVLEFPSHMLLAAILVAILAALLVVASSAVILTKRNSQKAPISTHFRCHNVRFARGLERHSQHRLEFGRTQTT